VIKFIIVTDSCFCLPHAVTTQNDDFDVVLCVDSNKMNEEKEIIYTV
jgi:hypothetical protein